MITINSSKVEGDFSDFPILIHITDPDLKSKARSDGYDILFTASDLSTKLDHERERYVSATGELIAWVEVPQLSSTTDTIIYMYYGNSGASDQQNIEGTWSNGYVGVYHMVEDSGSISNSASATNDGTRVNTPVRTNGQIGYGQEFSGGGADDMFNVGDLGIADGVDDEIAFSAWANIDNSNVEDWGKIISKRDSGDTTYVYAMSFNTDADRDVYPIINGNSGSAIIVDKSTWVYLAGRYNGTQKTFHINGTQVDSEDQSGALWASSADTTIGSRAGTQNFGGILDEVRFSDVARSAQWIETEFNNQNDTESFYYLSGEGPNEGFDDVVVGAYSLGTDQGRAYILYGPDLKMSGHAYSYAESLSLSELGSTATYTDYLTLTVNPPIATKYLILAASDVAPDDKVGDNTYLRLIVDDTDVYHETNREFQDVDDWYHFSCVKYIYLAAGSHNIQLEYKTEGDNGRFRNSRIIAIEIDIPADQYDENEDAIVTTGPEVTATETTFTPASSGDYLIVASANLRTESSSDSVWGRMYIDGTVYGETLVEPDDNFNERFNFGVIKNITLDTSAHTISLTVDSETPTVSTYMDHAHIAAIRLDTFSEFHYNEADGWNSGPGGWETLVTNSYIPKESGDFVILGTAAWLTNDATPVNGIRMRTFSTTRQESLIENRDNTDIHMTFQMDKRTLSGAQSDTVDHFMNSGGSSRFARLISLPLGLDYVRLTGVISNEEFGFSVSNAGDTNNTGYNDVIVGAPGTARAYIFCGSNAMDDDISATNANTMLIGIGGTRFGFSVGNASDINADGSYDDVIVGMPETANGNVWIYYGGNPMDIVPDVLLNGEGAGDKFGYSVHYAGDIDGDGDPDVIVGAPYFTNGSKTDCGAFYIFCGGSDIDATEEYKNEGEYAYDHFGWSVSYAGDLNGDNVNETLCGAPHYNTQAGETPSSSSDAGKAYGHSRFIIPEFSDSLLPITGIIALFVVLKARSRKRRKESGAGSVNMKELEDAA
jgi:hypothetical protein